MEKIEVSLFNFVEEIGSVRMKFEKVYAERKRPSGMYFAESDRPSEMQNKDYSVIKSSNMGIKSILFFGSPHYKLVVATRITPELRVWDPRKEKNFQIKTFQFQKPDYEDKTQITSVMKFTQNSFFCSLNPTRLFHIVQFDLNLEEKKRISLPGDKMFRLLKLTDDLFLIARKYQSSSIMSFSQEKVIRKIATSEFDEYASFVISKISGKCFFCNNKSECVEMINWETGKIEKKFNDDELMKSTIGFLYCLTTFVNTSCEEILACGGIKKKAFLFHVESEKLIQTIEFPAYIYSMATIYNRYVVCGDYDARVYLMDSQEEGVMKSRLKCGNPNDSMIISGITLMEFGDSKKLVYTTSSSAGLIHLDGIKSNEKIQELALGDLRERIQSLKDEVDVFVFGDGKMKKGIFLKVVLKNLEVDILRVLVL